MPYVDYVKTRDPKATVFVAGCFNRVHNAHLRTLRLARALGDRLVVVLAHDSHNHKPNAVPARQRLARLLELGLADKVVIGAAGSFAESLRRERPDILALGYDQRLPDAATEAAVRQSGVRVVTLPWSPGKEEHHACQYVF
jgi:FAD synthetase